MDLQLRASALAKIFSRSTQAVLFQTCVPSNGSEFVDHMDVIEDETTVVNGAGSSVQLSVPADVYRVSLASVMLAENAAPPAEAMTKDRIIAAFALSVTGTALSVALDDLRLEPPNPTLNPVLTLIKASFPQPGGLGLQPLFDGLGLSSPTSSVLLVVDDVVSINFDSAGTPQVHLFTGQEWGLFIDGPGMVDLVRSFLPMQLPFGARTELNWNPAGTTPRVSGRIVGNLPDPAAGTFEIPLSVSFSLAGSASPTVRATVQRGKVQLHGTGFGGLVEGAVEPIVDKEIQKAFDRAAAKGVKINELSFFIDKPMPRLAFAGARLQTTSMQANALGMTVGGSVTPTFADWATLSISLTRFGLPTWFGTCRGMLGRPAPRTLKIGDVTCIASVEFSSFGAFCGVTMLEQSGIAASYLTVPQESGSPDAISFSIPANIAKDITADVRIILRTARGVRLINFGKPIVNVDEDGNVEFNAVYINNCLQLTDDQLSMIEWVKGDRAVNLDILNPPLEDPNWVKLVTAGQGLEIQLISFAGLTPGELVSFRSADHAIDVTANGLGQVMVPVFFSLSESNTPMTLQRINRKSVAGTFRITSASFARVSTEISGTTNPAFALASAATALNPQPLPPPEANELFLKAASLVPGLHRVVPVPGFEGEPVVVAHLTDGSAVLLQDDGSGSVRIAGSFKGPIGVATSAGRWAKVPARNNVVQSKAVF